MTFLPISRYADIGDCQYADIADIFIWEDLMSITNLSPGIGIGIRILEILDISAIFFPWPRQYSSRYFADMSPNADIQISALKKFADSRYADIEKSADMPILPMPI